MWLRMIYPRALGTGVFLHQLLSSLTLKQKDADPGTYKSTWLKWWGPRGCGQGTPHLCYTSPFLTLILGIFYLSLFLTTYNHTVLKCWYFFFYSISGIWSSCLQLQSKIFSFQFLLAICNLLHTSSCQLALSLFIIPNTAVKSFLS